MSLVSIVIPVYNRPKLVADAIESVLLQTYENWELIVVDDISTDNTWEVLLDYQQKDKRIKAVKRHRCPKGAPTCRNIGADMAQGKYLIFWDSDDLMAPWCVKERVKFMEENGELDFGLFQLLNINLNKNKIYLRCNTEKGDNLYRFLTFKSAWGTPAVIWCAKSFEKINGWDEEALSWQDGEVHIRAIIIGMKYQWGTKVPSGIIRKNFDDISITNSISKQEEHLLNRINIFYKISLLLNDKYFQEFKNAVVARVWFETHLWPSKAIKKIAKHLNNKKFFSRAKKNELIFVNMIYNVFKEILVIKGLLYRILIRDKFKDYVFFKHNLSGAEEIKEFYQKIELLDFKSKCFYKKHIAFSTEDKL